MAKKSSKKSPKKSADKPLSIRDRVKELRRVRAGDIVSHKQNARLHPRKQQQAVKALLSEVGYVDALLARELPDGRLQLVDGHLRKDLTPDQEVPVLILDIDEHEALKILATFDRTTEMAEWDEDMLSEILPQLDFTHKDALKAFDKKFLDKILDGDNKKNNLLSQPGMVDGVVAGMTGGGEDDGGSGNDAGVAQETVQGTGVYMLNKAARFSSTNEWGLPDFRADMLSDCVPKKVWNPKDGGDTNECLFLWGSVSKSQPVKDGVLAFYAHDEEFEKIWNEPTIFIAEEVNSQRWKAVVSADFSTWRGDPWAVQLWNVYRSRWLARYWQEVGLPVIPNLSFSDESTYDFSFGTIPEGCPVVSVQCRTTGDKEGRKLFFDGLRAAIEVIKPKEVLIYGGAEHYSWFEEKEGELPGGSQYHFYYSFRTLIGNQRDNQLNKSSHKPGVKS